ncbi:6-phosphogluconate dehydrogenase (decarboxylating) [Candidatus Gottesmanbacteria bacterium RIFCSPHIGHO2_02_FULL_39_11]|uniref:6-phosphogluconate dehydrogenase (Decarboxylating) n=1 Tax=Candidatus Gottesmanbacteria bacterium RIFCSPHIGHO2_02_FULL_39_11 TaxID=1798382 RepID=A0A1F5ZNC9_9BACT|nr:MAG: 6-phosphogluconate dehydrogenase (decarboxylating) [Candidatus Gottesmanbacteria bacterium RIFCSPHIGHO2_02_FULL_39_11]
MKIGFIGLGRMGANMVLHMLEEGVDVSAYNRSPEKTKELVEENKQQITNNKKKGTLIPSYSIKELVGQLASPKIIWIMVAAGAPVDSVIEELLNAGIGPGDIIIDGGNSFYKDTERRFKQLKEKKIHYLGIGTSGGLDGARNGACLMIGGEKEVFEGLTPLFNSLIGTMGTYTYFGEGGAGHFVKMVHNGIEYGMLQSIGEGFDLLHQSPYKLDLKAVSGNWTKGSVVRGWLVELLDKYLQKDPNITQSDGRVGGGETGRWMLETAKEAGIKMYALEAAVRYREDSGKGPTFTGKVITAIRWMFGRHEK